MGFWRENGVQSSKSQAVEPERATEAREARRSGELSLKILIYWLTESMFYF